MNLALAHITSDADVFIDQVLQAASLRIFEIQQYHSNVRFSWLKFFMPCIVLKNTVLVRNPLSKKLHIIDV